VNCHCNESRISRVHRRPEVALMQRLLNILSRRRSPSSAFFFSLYVAFFITPHLQPSHLARENNKLLFHYVRLRKRYSRKRGEGDNASALRRLGFVKNLPLCCGCRVAVACRILFFLISPFSPRTCQKEAGLCRSRVPRSTASGPAAATAGVLSW